MGGRERAKHIDIRKHFAHEAVQNGHIRLIKIPTEFQLADLLTKGPPSPVGELSSQSAWRVPALGGWLGLRPLASEGGETTEWISSWSHVGP